MGNWIQRFRMRTGDGKIHKKAFFALGLCMVLCLSGCSFGGGTGDSPADTVSSGEAAAQSTVKDTVIAVSMPSAARGWDYEACQSAGEYLAGLSDDKTGYILLTASSGEEQFRQLNELIGQNVHGVVIYPVDSESAAQGAANLKASGIPVVVFNGSFAGVNADVTVAMDEEALGKNAGASVADAGCEAMDILVFTDESRTESSLRLKGFEAGLSDELSVTFGGNSAGSTASARQALLDWIENRDSQALENIGGIFASDEDTLLGILEGLDSYESTYGTVFPQLKIIAGCGSSDELLTWIESYKKYPVCTWYYAPEVITEAIDLALEAVSGQVPEQTVAVSASSADNGSME